MMRQLKQFIEILCNNNTLVKWRPYLSTPLLRLLMLKNRASTIIFLRKGKSIIEIMKGLSLS